MHRAWVILTALGLLGSSALFEEADLPDAAHHGLRHVEGDVAGHHHGDPDDHHETPDSPCHHHETQICFGHAHDYTVSASISIVEPGAAELFNLITINPSENYSIHLIFHIPIA